jgi:RND family efflux transporter MFP subunit
MRSLVRTRFALWLPAMLALATCGGKQASPPQPAGHGLASHVVQPVTVPTERAVDGTIQAVDHATMAAQTGGRITALLHDVGDAVPAGALILRITAIEQQAGAQGAEAALAEAGARHDEAVASHLRSADLYRRQLVPKAELDQAVANRDAAAARLAATQAALIAANQGVAYTEVRAPYAGVIGARLVEVGETVSPGTPLATVLSLRRLRVDTHVPQGVVAQLRRLGKAAVYLGEQRIEATRITLFPEAATPSSTFRAWLYLPPGVDGLLPGMHVKVGLVTGEATVLTVPQSAVVEHSEITGVYVIDARGTVALRYVRLGRRSGADIAVLAGLAAGEAIATDPVAAAAAAVANAPR